MDGAEVDLTVRVGDWIVGVRHRMSPEELAAAVDPVGLVARDLSSIVDEVLTEVHTSPELRKLIRRG